MICKYCKREIPDYSTFCLFCGEKLIKTRNSIRDLKIPEPTPTKSGRWRIQLRKENISITKDTADECRAAAMEARLKWQVEESAGLHVPPPAKLLLSDAMDIYIASKSNILSPSTIRAYKSIRHHRFQSCMGWDLKDDSLNWQMAVNLEATEVLPQTLGNAWHLIATVFKFFNLTPPKVALPKRIKSERPFLRYDEIEKFLSAVKGEEVELGALLALNSLRLSEIISLQPTDISSDGKTISVHAARVLNSDNELVYRETNKTEKSTRSVSVVIPRLQELLVQAAQSSDEYIFDWTGKKTHDHINRVCKRAGLPMVGVHGLRHSFASLGYHLGWKKKSTMEVGGWANSQIVDNVYTHNADLDDDLKRMEEFYESLFS